jgi:hypothetical protein
MEYFAGKSFASKILARPQKRKLLIPGILRAQNCKFFDLDQLATSG